ncbi:hypothetical protein M5K25_012471 [Dendrobium thyrsiflorum]|uniref:Uncharacterized protein n=1 Tax=Dendrobium thyrsiflorum TaxID=117978 RepID=A0ABD0V4V9_DENTH
MASPLEIGAQGTIGSLISHEVEYFKKVDLGDWKSSQRIKSKILVDEASASNSFKLNKESDSNNVKKKKKKKEKKQVKEGKYLPSICSAIEISEKNTSRKENRMLLQKHQVDEFREEKNIQHTNRRKMKYQDIYVENTEKGKTTGPCPVEMIRLIIHVNVLQIGSEL